MGYSYSQNVEYNSRLIKENRELKKNIKDLEGKVGNLRDLAMSAVHSRGGKVKVSTLMSPDGYMPLENWLLRKLQEIGE